MSKILDLKQKPNSHNKITAIKINTSQRSSQMVNLYLLISESFCKYYWYDVAR